MNATGEMSISLYFLVIYEDCGLMLYFIDIVLFTNLIHTKSRQEK